MNGFWPSLKTRFVDGTFITIGAGYIGLPPRTVVMVAAWHPLRNVLRGAPFGSLKAMLLAANLFCLSS